VCCVCRQVHEHSTGHTPFYWQKPRNQLTLLAAFGTNLWLSFFDLDEYLVLPQGGTLDNSSCAGRPLLGSSISNSSGRHLLDTVSSPMQGDGSSSSRRRMLDNSNTSSSSSSSSPLLGGSSPVGSFAQYSARSCEQGVELDCWREGVALPTAAVSELVIERCPCQFPKPLVSAERVLTLSVHYVWAWGAKVTDIPPSCGFLLHLHALVNERSHMMPEGLEPHHLVSAHWRLPEAGSAQLFTNDSTAIAAHLHDPQYCAELRKDFAKRYPGTAKLSMC
jgi:hypothetical protein